MKYPNGEYSCCAERFAKTIIWQYWSEEITMYSDIYVDIFVKTYAELLPLLQIYRALF